MGTRPFKGLFPICGTVHDLSRRPAAKGFSATFREFLDKQNATSLELLHSPQHIRKLNDMSSFLRAGIYALRSEEHTSELQSLMRISYAVFCLKKKKHNSYYTTLNTYRN